MITSQNKINFITNPFNNKVRVGVIPYDISKANLLIMVNGLDDLAKRFYCLKVAMHIGKYDISHNPLSAGKAKASARDKEEAPSVQFPCKFYPKFR